MNIGDKMLAEGVITQVCDGFCVMRFDRVGAQAVKHVRITTEALHSPIEAVAVPPAPKPRRVAVAH
jgi:hypothetical protein